jgi:hypothetical protein
MSKSSSEPRTLAMGTVSRDCGPVTHLIMETIIVEQTWRFVAYSRFGAAMTANVSTDYSAVQV